MTEDVTITVPRTWTTAVLAAGTGLGVGAAFGVEPLMQWLVGLLGAAPGPLRLAAELPLVWAIPVLAAVGLALGAWVCHEWRKEAGVVTVSADGVTVTRDGAGEHIARARIGGVFTDGRDLIITDEHVRELLRSKTDTAMKSRLHRAFADHGYPWLSGDDPNESAFTTWIDGAGDLGPRAHELLRARRRALADDRPGAADDARDELRGLGVMVRDRGDCQQVRVADDRR